MRLPGRVAMEQRRTPAGVARRVVGASLRRALALVLDLFVVKPISLFAWWLAFGLEKVMPIGSRRWIDSGHRIDVRWRPLDGGTGDLEGDAQAIADRVREAVIALQAEWRAVATSGAFGPLQRPTEVR